MICCAPTGCSMPRVQSPSQDMSLTRHDRDTPTLSGTWKASIMCESSRGKPRPWLSCPSFLSLLTLHLQQQMQTAPSQTASSAHIAIHAIHASPRGGSHPCNRCRVWQPPCPLSTLSASLATMMRRTVQVGGSRIGEWHDCAKRHGLWAQLEVMPLSLLPALPLSHRPSWLLTQGWG